VLKWKNSWRVADKSAAKNLKLAFLLGLEQQAWDNHLKNQRSGTW
jgi:hypothetical protein